MQPKPPFGNVSPGTIDPHWLWALQGLEFAVLYREGVGAAPLEIIRGVEGTPSGSPTWAFSDHGPAMDLDGSDYHSWPNARYPDSLFTGAMSILWAGVVDTGSAFRHFAGKHLTNGGTNNPFDFRTDNSATPKLYLGRANASVGVSSTSTAGVCTPGAFRVYAGSCASGSLAVAPKLYADGVLLPSSQSGGAATTVTGANAAIRVGRRADNFVQMDGKVSLLLIWSRELQAAEMLRLGEDPFGPFRPAQSGPETWAPTVTATARRLVDGGLVNAPTIGRLVA